MKYMAASPSQMIGTVENIEEQKLAQDALRRSEALFRAGIRPRRQARGLKRQEVARLVESIRKYKSRSLSHLIAKAHEKYLLKISRECSIAARLEHRSLVRVVGSQK